MKQTSRTGTGRTGMTLVELMIVLAVLAILAAMAWPSYQNAVQRSRRSDGMAALAQIMQAQERWRANKPAYTGTLSDLLGDKTSSQNGHYVLGVSVPTNATSARTQYTATATVASGSPQSGDARCQILQVDIDGGNISYSSKASASGAANSAPDPCWSK